jgi:hypothetical protein
MTQSTDVPPPARSRLFQRHWTWWFMVLVLVVVAAVRLRLLNFPLERDEGEYAYSGQLMLQGIPPYQLAYNMKFPGTYAAYAVIMALFGQTPAGIHFGVLCMTTLTALMLFWLGRQILDWTAGMVATTAYAVMAASLLCHRWLVCDVAGATGRQMAGHRGLGTPFWPGRFDETTRRRDCVVGRHGVSGDSLPPTGNFAWQTPGCRRGFRHSHDPAVCRVLSDSLARGSFWKILVLDD